MRESSVPTLHCLLTSLGNCGLTRERIAGSGRCKLRQVHSNPNVFEIDNFLTDTELEHIGRIVAAKFARSGGFQSSKVNTEDDAILGVENEFRTSTTMWLNKQQDTITRNIEARAAGLLGYASTHSEPLQIVHYTEGQFFDTHHDVGTLMEDGSVEALPPLRVATFFVYLNSLPEGCGCTTFPALNGGKGFACQPVRGKALLFCNLNEDCSPDVATVHKAMPVEGGIHKFGMNIWISGYSMQHTAMLPGKESTVVPEKKKHVAEEVMKFFAPDAVQKENKENSTPPGTKSKRGGKRAAQGAAEEGVPVLGGKKKARGSPKRG